MKLGSKVLLLLFGIGLFSCDSSVKFPPVPYLEYVSDELFSKDFDPDNNPFDYAEVNLYFTDGDGNLGQDNDFDGIRCRDVASSCNIFVDVNSKVNGVYDTSYTYDAIIKSLTPSSQNPALEGNIIYKVSLASRLSDTVQLDFWIYDRDLNKSNVASTPEIWVDL